VGAYSTLLLVIAKGKRRGSLGVGFENMRHSLGHEMMGLAGPGRGGTSMAGGRQGQGARKAEGVRGRRLPSPPCCFENLLMYIGFLSR